MKIDHELCSELLGPFLRGELDPERRREVEAHTASCEACREELHVLEALSGPPVQPLSEMESARLHRAVWTAVGSPRRERKALGARLIPYLGTAAVLALFAVGAVTLGGDGSGDGSGDAATQRVADTFEEQQGLSSTAAEEGGDLAESDTAGSGQQEAATDASAETLEAASPEDGNSSEQPGVAAYDSARKEAFGVGCGIGMGGANPP